MIFVNSLIRSLSFLVDSRRPVSAGFGLITASVEWIKKRLDSYIYMGQKLQDGKKVLEMSVTTLHSKCRPIQTIHPTDLGLLPSWISISRPPAQEFSPSWDNF